MNPLSPTLADVARAAGVSPSTASCALNGHAIVKPATRLRIEEAASRLGYQRNAAAAALAGRYRHGSPKSRQLGLAYLTYPEEPQGAECHARFRAEAERLGYHAEKVDLGSFPTPEAASRYLRTINIQGLYLTAHAARTVDRWSGFCWERFALIKQSRRAPEIPCDIIEHNAYAFTHMAMQRTFEAGYRRIALILGRSQVHADDEARLGAALGQFHLSKQPRCHLQWRFILSRDGNERHRAKAKLQRWLRTYQPDAVVAFPWEFVEVLAEAGFQIPSDFGFVSVLLPVLSATSPLAGCAPRQEAAFAIRAASELHQKILRGERGFPPEPSVHEIEPVWVGNPSLPPRN